MRLSIEKGKPPAASRVGDEFSCDGELSAGIAGYRKWQDKRPGACLLIGQADHLLDEQEAEFWITLRLNRKGVIHAPQPSEIVPLNRDPHRADFRG